MKKKMGPRINTNLHELFCKRQKKEAHEFSRIFTNDFT
jgi:hypothetical protein